MTSTLSSETPKTRSRDNPVSFWYHRDNGLPELAIKKHQSRWTAIAPTTITLLDDVERHITSADQYLLRLGGDIRLCQGEFIQDFPHAKPFKFALEAQDGALSSALFDLTGYRLIEPILKRRIGTATLALRDTEGKCVARLEAMLDEQSTWLSVTPIRGYDKAYQQVLKRLQKLGYRQSASHYLTQLASQLVAELPPVQLPGIYQPNRSDTVGQAVLTMCSDMLAIARCHETGVLDKSEDTEYLHDYRVALRKTRSLLSLMKGIFPSDLHGKLKQQLADIMRPTNQARDLDVYLLEQADYEALLPANLGAGLPLMFEDFRKQHGLVYRHLKNWLQSRQYQTDIHACETVFASLALSDMPASASSNVLDYVNRLVQRKYQKIMRSGSVITPQSPDDEVHDLRLECKKFRYLLDFFGALYDQQYHKVLLKRLKRMQNTLGLFNDYSVQQEALYAYLQQPKLDASVHRSVGALILVLSQKQVEQRRLVEAKFAEFAQPQTAQLIQKLFGRDNKKNTKQEVHS